MQARKKLLRTWDNRFCWWSLFIIIVGAIFQTAIYATIVFTFKVAIEAGLNIGITQSIWAINPFFISILERVFYHTPFNFKQIYGMSAIVLGAILISLSEVITPKEADPTAIVAVAGEKLVPVW